MRGGFGPTQDVNDRPDVASSFPGVAVAAVYGACWRDGRRERPGLAEAALPLTSRLAVVPARDGEAELRRLFAPRGYAVSAKPHSLDPAIPAEGVTRFFTVEL